MATILVVDDNATNRALLVRVLERDGHRVIEAANGAEALGLIWLELPDLVLTDILMPRVDGYVLDRELRASPRTSHLPVIFHTATYTAAEVSELAGTTHRRVLPKPTDIETISATVAEMVSEGPSDPVPARADEQHVHLDLLNAKLIQKVRELELADRQRQQLLASVVRAQEDERQRIAGEIHDDPVQAMTAVAMRLELAGPRGDDVASLERHEKLLTTVRDAISRLRRLIFQLHPPALDRDGLGPAIEAFLVHTTDETDLAYEVDDRLERHPPSELRALLYRVVQEALTNVTKHAEADTVRVTLEERGDGVRVEVRDDGRGFSVADVDRPRPGHLGLTTMRQRVELVGGSWEVRSAPGEGTVVRAWVPTVTDARRHVG